MQKVNFAFNPWPQLNLNLLAPGLLPPGHLHGRLSASCGELATNESSLKLQIRTDRPPVRTDGLYLSLRQAWVGGGLVRREGD